MPFIRIEVQDGEIGEILKELEEAKETIYRCYSRLRELEVITIKKDAARGN